MDGRIQDKPAEFDRLSSERLPPEAVVPDPAFAEEFLPPYGPEFGPRLGHFGSSPPSDAPASRPPARRTSRNCCRIEEPISNSSRSYRHLYHGLAIITPLKF